MKCKLCVLLAIVLVVGLLCCAEFCHQAELDQTKQQLIQELEDQVGTYDSGSIILYDVSKTQAQKLADQLGASLRISADEHFAALRLQEGASIRDVVEEEALREYLDQMGIDYHVQISDVTEETEDDIRLPVSPIYSGNDAGIAQQTYLDYLNVGDTWSSYTGSGVTVAVIDTGIDTDHPEFAGRISEYSYNATEDKIVKDYLLEDGSYDWSLIEDEQGHGTAVTGVIAAAMNDGGTVGIAPDVNIIVIKAECDESGQFTNTSDLVFGLYYAIERDVQVVNMSFGTSDSVVFQATVQLAYDSDVICVAAAGNVGTAINQYPAAYETVIGVGALDAASWTLADYSNYGENTDLVAPGTTYTTAMGGGYETKTGTSMSAPQVAGAVALFMQTNRYATFDKVSEVLYASGYDLGDLGRDWEYGFGALDLQAFLLEERGTVTFHMLTDELENEEALFIRGHAMQELPEPERLYAVFDGWYYDITLTQKYEYYTDAFTADLTLYAKWANEDDAIPYTYVILADDTVEIRSYTGHRKYITIPEMIEGRVVSSIGDFAFSGERDLREVTLPSGLCSIGESAFSGCSNLVSISIPAGVREIGDNAFADSVRLSTVSIADGSKLETIGKFAFLNCGKLRQIELPATVRSVDGSAFVGALSLTRIGVRSGNEHYLSNDGVLFTKDGNTLVAYPVSHGSTYDLPENCVTIGEYGFAYCKLDTIDLKTVQTIGKSAFFCAALKTLQIPDSVTEMDFSAFASNFNLRQVTIGAGLDRIAEYAFNSCLSLNKIVIPSGITEIGGCAFAGSGLREVCFAEDSQLTQISDGSFFGTQLVSVDIPATVHTIGESAFGSTPLKTVTFGSNSQLRVIGAKAFYGCRMLPTIALPDGLETIGELAFASTGLQSITVPASVKELGAGAFAYCQQLPNVEVEGANEAYVDENGVVYTADHRIIHTYPAGKTESTYTVLDTAYAVEKYAFAGTENLTTVVLCEGMEELRERAFHSSGIDYMEIPDSVIQISRYTFAECWDLSTVTFSENVRIARLSYAAFGYSGLTSFRVPANVSTMGQKVFEGCKNLTQITFASGSKLESLSAYQFSGCENLLSVVFEPGSALTSIQAHGLEGMDKLVTIDFGDAAVTNVDNFAFRFCTSLTEVNLPDSLLSIGRYAFYGCKQMTVLQIPANVEHIGSYAFLGTNDMEIYLMADSLPEFLDENWDQGIRGYYVGVASVNVSGDFRYAVLNSGDIAILEYLGSDKTVDLTQMALGGDIVTIGGSAFENNAVEQIVLPQTLREIYAEAFMDSALKSVEIPASARFIGREAFANTPVAQVQFQENSVLSVIEQYAFENTKQLKRVTLPASLSTMGTGAFQESGLTEVRFETGIALTEIPKNAFAGTMLTSVDLPDSITLVNYNAFQNVETLTSVSFGNGEEIWLMGNAFYHTGLTQLHIPANVTYIGEYCFVALTELDEFTVAEENPNYTAVDGLLMDKKQQTLIAVPAGRTGSLTVPKSVEIIGFGAFEESHLTSVKFHQDANILTLGYRAFFKANSIREITIPASVVSIDYYAFAYCENLETVRFEEGNQLKGIYEGAFCGDVQLENITIPESIVEISEFAFYGCSALDTIPVADSDALKGIYDYAFAYTGLSGEMTMPENLIDIGSYAFMGTKLENVTITDTMQKDLIIGIGAFEACEYLEEITLPFIGASYEGFEISWFGYIFGAGSYEANETYVPKSLKTVTISEGITFVGIGGFANCTGLEYIHVPESVTELYHAAFANTTAIYELYNPVTTYQIDQWGDVICAVTSGHIGQGISGTVEFTPGVAVRDSLLFHECKNVRHVILPEGLTQIGAFMFRGCESLRTVYIPSSVREIGSCAFTGCGSLVEVILPEGVTTVEDSAFNGAGLTRVVLPSTLTEIGNYAFGCGNLYEIQNNSKLSLTFGSAEYGSVAENAKVIIDANGNQSFRDGVTSFAFVDTEDGFRFAQENGSYKLVAYIGNETTVRLPESINGQSYVLDNFGGVNTLIIPGTMKNIPDWMFYGSAVPNFILEYGVETIGEYAFASNWSLKTVVLPESLKEIGNGAFVDCQNMESINIPDSVTTIGGSAFNCCYMLKEIHIPEGVTALEGGVFNWCFALERVEIPDSVTVIENNAFNRCEKLQEVVMSQNVTTIGESAFNGCISLKAITLPQTVQEIGIGAFPSTTEVIMTGENENYRYIDGIMYDRDLTRIIFTTENIPADVILPDTVTTIPAYAFQNNSVIRSIVIPKGVTILEDGVFQGSSLERIELQEGLITVSGSFEDCDNLTEVVLPAGLQHLGWDTFRDCSNLRKVVIPDSVTYIGGYTFLNCSSLYEVNIPYGIEVIEEHAFDGTQLVNIYIPSTVTRIERYAFSSSIALQEITIPDTVEYIGEGAFAYSRSLERITLGKNVTEITKNAFRDCEQLYYISNRSNLALTFGSQENGQIALNAKVIVDANGETQYADPTVDYEVIDTVDGFRFVRENGVYKLVGYYGEQDTITLPESIDGNAYILWKFNGGKTVIIPDGWTEIGDHAFQNNATTERFVIPESVTRIGVEAFRGCNSLQNIALPEGLTQIDTYAFLECYGLTDIEIPDTVTSIGYGAFASCRGLKKVDIPNSVLYLGDFIFSACSNLTEATLPQYITTIPMGLFYRCDSLETITIPSTVTQIKDHAFFACTSLKGMIIPETVTYLGEYVFSHCASLKELSIPQNVEFIGSFQDIESGGMTSGLYENPEYWSNGMLMIDGWLLDVADDLEYLSNIHEIKNVAESAYVNCNRLKNPVLGCDFQAPTNMETLIIPSSMSGYVEISNTLTLKNVVILDTVGASDPYNNSWLFSQLSDVTIWIESSEDELQWDKNFPGWNYGNRVIYGDNWIWADFYNADGTLLSSEPLRTSQIIRRPVVMDYSDAVYAYHFVGWDLDGNGTADSIPATSSVDIQAVAVYERHVKTYTVTFMDAQTGIIYSQEVLEYGSAIVPPADPAVEGKVFDGWSGFSQGMIVTGDMTFYAKWKHIHSEETISGVAATCTETGLTDGTKCSICGEILVAQEIIPATGHNYESAIVDPTCTEQGYTTHTCTRCGDTYVDTYTDATGHSYGEWYVIENATCTETGTERRDCDNCDHCETREIAKLGHDYKAVVTEPTCEEEGYTTHTCTRCGDTYVDTYVNALGHDMGAWYVVDEATVDVPGLERRDCSRCDYHEERELVWKDNPFVDVPDNAYFYEPIMWAIEMGITNGTGPDTFDPEATCTREQIVTFLWRAAGKPEPTLTENPFTDVTEASYAYKAILWAVENGITTGTSATTFGLQDVCTREQVATFLWRAAGKPMPESTENPFTDLNEGNFGYLPILWAAENGITTGYGNGLFGLNDTCTRGQIVTFLYRAFAEQ